MYMPPGSPTQSVEAALAFNEGNKLRGIEKENAIAHYTDAIEADPKFEIAYYNRALTLAELGKIKDADSDLEKLRTMNSDRVETLEALIGVARDLSGG
jgi:tetratricopeptide (TPR) repeat protein